MKRTARWRACRDLEQFAQKHAFRIRRSADLIQLPFVHRAVGAASVRSGRPRRPERAPGANVVYETDHRWPFSSGSGQRADLTGPPAPFVGCTLVRPWPITFAATPLDGGAPPARGDRADRVRGARRSRIHRDRAGTSTGVSMLAATRGIAAAVRRPRRRKTRPAARVRPGRPGAG